MEDLFRQLGVLPNETDFFVEFFKIDFLGVRDLFGLKFFLGVRERLDLKFCLGVRERDRPKDLLRLLELFLERVPRFDGNRVGVRLKELLFEKLREFLVSVDLLLTE